MYLTLSGIWLIIPETASKTKIFMKYLLWPVLPDILPAILVYTLQVSKLTRVGS